MKAANPFDPRDEAERMQDQASDPYCSAWVGASAGTGKTHILTRRVLRLLLSGARPNRLLCLTYTRAAAAEMKNRIMDELARWAVMPVIELDEVLRKLSAEEKEKDSSKLRIAARRLFARVLDSPGGLQIDTIHAFCGSILRRFPIEAKVPPHFQTADEYRVREIKRAARDSVLRRAETDPLLQEALEILTKELEETGFDKLLEALTHQSGRLKQLFAQNDRDMESVPERDIEKVTSLLAERLNLEPEMVQAGTNAADIVLRAACGEHSFAGANLRRVAGEGLLAFGGINDQKYGAEICTWLACSVEERIASFDKYYRIYFTDKGTPRKNFPSQKTLKNMPDADSILNAEMLRLMLSFERLKSVQSLIRTASLLRIGHAWLMEYKKTKRMYGLLDYDDLILATKQLLRQGVAWVQFKLDGGIEHLLVDEAQDTNPDQWQIIAALASEFFNDAQRGARERTLFVVGDVKQSIYSFQGADPKAFIDLRAEFRRQITALDKQAFVEVSMETSFRSTDTVLAAVDAIFAADKIAAQGVKLDAHPVRHRADREGHAGIVELWPIFASENEKATEKPIDRLVIAIARQIQHWIASKALLESRGRPIRPSDILILVRNRKSLVELLIKHLSALQIPIAGADRMVLNEQLVVQDMLVLARFLLLPDDDLSLATVLKGPFIGWNDEQLMRLALPTDGGSRDLNISLWQNLRMQAIHKPEIELVLNFLTRMLRQVDHVSPFQLFADLLARPVPSGSTGQAALLGRLGLQARDPLDEFLTQALNFQQTYTPSLQAFLYWFETAQSEIKRDQEQARIDQVRVMTVHGAKGLQAPIVFLIENLGQNPMRDSIFWLPIDDSGLNVLPLWSPRQDTDEAVAAAARTAAKVAADAEEARLLYVALTRAEDRLYICGWHNKTRSQRENWYDMVKAGLDGLSYPIDLAAWPAWLSAEEGCYLRLTRPQKRPVQSEVSPSVPDLIIKQEAMQDQENQINSGPVNSGPIDFNGTDFDWIDSPVREQPLLVRPLAVSALDTDTSPVHSPLPILTNDETSRISKADIPHRFRRGILIHRLLQFLPELPPQSWESKAEAWLASPAHRLKTEQQNEILHETLKVMQHTDFAPLFGTGSRAEVPVTGLVLHDTETGPTPLAISGRIDRLLITSQTVFIVDYKTMRPPPEKVEAVSFAYRRQLAAYRALLHSIYPNRSIFCALLWTDGPRMMRIPDTLLAAEGLKPFIQT